MPLSLSPKELKVSHSDINDVSAWFYEEPFGFEIIVEIPIFSGKYIHIKITWRTILASVKRYLATKKRRSR